MKIRIISVSGGPNELWLNKSNRVKWIFEPQKRNEKKKINQTENPNTLLVFVFFARDEKNTATSTFDRIHERNKGQRQMHKIHKSCCNNTYPRLIC